MMIYTAENNGAYPGSGSTSGHGIWHVGTPAGNFTINSGYNINNVPDTNEALDWCGPLAKAMGLPQFRSAALALDGVARFKAYCNAPQFRCPSYNGNMWTVGTDGSNTDAGPQQAFSYITAMAFMVLPYQDGVAALPVDPLNGGYGANVYCIKPQYGFQLPSGYFPKMGKLGDPSRKVYMADGARRSVTSNMTAGPQFNAYALRTNCWSGSGGSCQNQTMFSDWGPPFGATKAFDRSMVPGNNTRPDRDVRPLAFRHGKTGEGLAPGSYRMNALFFDGHAEAMDDVTAANPTMWLPKGTTLIPNASLSNADSNGTATAIFNDVISAYKLQGYDSTNPFIVP